MSDVARRRIRNIKALDNKFRKQEGSVARMMKEIADLCISFVIHTINILIYEMRSIAKECINTGYIDG